MAVHHYLPSGFVRQMFTPYCTAVDTVAGPGGLAGGAFKVQARDHWIGWTPIQRCRRLHLIAHNSRFAVLPGGGASCPQNLYMMFKSGLCAEKTWRRQRGLNAMVKVIEGVTFRDGIEVIESDRAVA